MIIRGTALLAFFCLASAASAAPLWQNVESGMSSAQIRAAQPTAEPDAEASALHSGARCELSIRSLEVASYRFKVCFYMQQGKLEQVTLQAADPSETMFSSTVDLLRAKYGPEIGAGGSLCKRGMLTTCEAKWLLKSGVNVDALFMSIQGTDPLVNINYQTRMASDASKL